jgi:hypothetical protein
MTNDKGRTPNEKKSALVDILTLTDGMYHELPLFLVYVMNDSVTPHPEPV